MDQIICPHCKKTFPMSDAIRHAIEEKVRTEEITKLKAQFEKEKKDEADDREKKLREEFELKTKNIDKELEDAKKELTKQQEEKEKSEAKIKEDAKKKAQEESSLEVKALKKQLDDAREAEKKANKASEDLKRKLNQESQQLQGEVGELWLEEELKKAFSYDDLKPVPKGINGGDIVHVVRNKFGNTAGTILWEAKRQKAWSKAWLTKLKDDMRKIGASDCIIVSDILPPNVKTYDRLENVWVTSYEYAINLATALRIGILNVAIARSGNSHSDENLKKFYDIVNSDRFRHALEARKEIIETMEKELEADKASTDRKWRRQTDNIGKLKNNNRELVGMLEDHVPALKSLTDNQYPTLDDGTENEQESLI